MFRQICLVLVALFTIAACTGAPAEPTAQPTLTPFPTRQAVATRTPFGAGAPTVTPLVSNGQVNNPLPPTAVIPATAVLPATQRPVGPVLLNNGRGLSNGATMNSGEFQVEGYCAILNREYGAAEDGTDWFCTFQGQRALTLRKDQFDDICRRTYNNQNAVAIQGTGARAAYQWRCYEIFEPPTPTPSAPAQLLNNGRGITTGQVMNNGEMQIEGYCQSINPAYGVDVDQNYWYCTHNGNRILTLGIAEFDDICIRTYNNPAAHAMQISSTDRPAYRWRCFVIPS